MSSEDGVLLFYHIVVSNNIGSQSTFQFVNIFVASRLSQIKKQKKKETKICICDH